MQHFTIFSFTMGTDTVIDVELPGVDPKEVKLTYSTDEGRMYLNNTPVAAGLNPKYLDLAACKADLKNGLLRVIIPQKKPHRTEVTISVG